MHANKYAAWFHVKKKNCDIENAKAIVKQVQKWLSLK